MASPSQPSTLAAPEMAPRPGPRTLVAPEAHGEHARERGRRPGRATVFGLDVLGRPLPSVLEGARAAATGRRLQVSQIDRAEARRSWPDDATTICRQARRDGSEYFAIEAHPRAGYRVWGESFGTYLLSGDGEQLRFTPRGPRAAHERFLVGQVLPFAALLAGLEIFHASAVVLDGRAVAFAGPSGAGKTSLALELCARGASFLADDVLALEPRGERLVAHPGAPLAGVAHAEVARRREAGDEPRGELIATNARERLIRVCPVAGPVALGALFLLDRRAAGSGAPRFEPVSDPRALLASTFNFVLDTRERMVGLLEVCALAARTRVERIAIPPTLDPGGLADSIVARLGAAS